MKKPPISVILISLLLAASGAAGLAYHFRELHFQRLFHNEALWIATVRIAAIVSGGFMLRGHNWARWLAMFWIGFHLVISIFHPWSQLVFHAVVFVVFAYVLFWRPAADFFRSEA